MRHFFSISRSHFQVTQKENWLAPVRGGSVPSLDLSHRTVQLAVEKFDPYQIPS